MFYLINGYGLFLSKTSLALHIVNTTTVF